MDSDGQIDNIAVAISDSSEHDDAKLTHVNFAEYSSFSILHASLVFSWILLISLNSLLRDINFDNWTIIICFTVSGFLHVVNEYCDK